MQSHDSGDWQNRRYRGADPSTAQDSGSSQRSSGPQQALQDNQQRQQNQRGGGRESGGHTDYLFGDGHGAAGSDWGGDRQQGAGWGSRQGQVPDDFRPSREQSSYGGGGYGPHDDFGAPQRGHGRSADRFDGPGSRGNWDHRDAEPQHRSAPHRDPDYDRWRTDQMRQLDNDYEAFQRERYSKFASDFDAWRKNRVAAGTTPMPAASPSSDHTPDDKEPKK